MLKETETGAGYTVRELNILSHSEAKFRPFKLTVPASQFNRLCSNEFPLREGVRVRRLSRMEAGNGRAPA